MTRPTLTVPTITPQMAGWDATINTAISALQTFVSGQPYALPLYTVASGAGQLPAAASYQYCLAVVSDATSGKGPVVVSDGTNWRYVSDNSVAL